MKIALCILAVKIAMTADLLGQCVYWTAFFYRQGYDVIGTARNCFSALPWGF